MGQKRKRQSDADGPEVSETAPPAKVQITEEAQNHSGLSKEQQKKLDKGLRKQLRSERKSKKVKNTKTEDLSGQQGPSNGVTADSFAQGQDFVSLSGGPPISEEKSDKKKVRIDQKALKKIVKPLKPGRAAFKAALYNKKSSPRSQRHAAKAEKARAAATDEYGEETLHNMDNSMQPDPSKKEPRFICFVGNLPYDCTMEQLQMHFFKLNPKSIRLPHDKITGKCKGYAFLEFAEYDKMKTCLKLYHHSIFEPELLTQRREKAEIEKAAAEANKTDSQPYRKKKKEKEVLPRIGDKKNKGRMINVELTAGGGGKGSSRHKKIKEKNVKLEEQRLRIKKEEQKKVAAKDRKEGKNGALQGVNATPVGGGDDNRDGAAADGRGDIHPSRLKRVQA